MSNLSSDLVRDYLIHLQNEICYQLELEDGKGQFRSDTWSRTQGGGGLSRVLTGGAVFEKAGVNFSDVSGKSLPPSATGTRPELAGASFRSMGVSLVIHPLNPYVPTTHANIRFFIAEKEGSLASDLPIWWFGGGFDLTPYYGFEEDAISWHQTAYNACKPFGEELYFRFKKNCDEYFYLKHRQETRGIGGLFFDDFNDKDFDYSFSLTQSIGNHFTKAYIPIVSRRKNRLYTDREKQFQLYRRGRYVEFNLIYDRGTLFGLQSQGRTESILMSLPPLVRWDYNWAPAPDTPEAELYKTFLKPQDWLNKPPEFHSMGHRSEKVLIAP